MRIAVGGVGWGSARRAVALGLCLAVVGCGGGGGGDTPPPPPRSLSGNLTYDKVPTSANGLDYASVVAKPIRGATVELMDGATVVATTSSDNAGHYAFSWPASGPKNVAVRVKALTSQPVIRVEDNTAGDALYAMASPVIDSSTVTTVNLNAPSGWGGSGYTGPRVAAPFAVLDAAYACARAFMAERPVVFPDLKINWSVNNRPEPGDKALGQIGTSHWDYSELYILGLADADTDEFDTMIIAHEWGHYFESKLSRADSPGGAHGSGEIKDPRLAWGEGWATALGAIVFYPDDFYTDTNGPLQANVGPHYSMGDNTADDPAPGWFSEMSMVHVFLDLWDPYSAAEPFDNVSISLGALYDVMTGFQKNTSAFTTVFSFVTGLITNDPSKAAAINTLLAHRGVAAPIENEFGLGTESNDGGVAGALPVYNVLVANDPPTTVTFTPTAPEVVFNSLAQNRFAGFDGSGSAVTLTAANADGKDIRIRIFEKGVEKALADNNGATPATISGFQTTAGVIYTVIITGGDIVGPGTYTAQVSLTSP